MRLKPVNLVELINQGTPGERIDAFIRDYSTVDEGAYAVMHDKALDLGYVPVKTKKYNWAANNRTPIWGVKPQFPFTKLSKLNLFVTNMDPPLPAYSRNEIDAVILPLYLRFYRILLDWVLLNTNIFDAHGLSEDQIPNLLNQLVGDIFTTLKGDRRDYYDFWFVESYNLFNMFDADNRHVNEKRFEIIEGISYLLYGTGEGAQACLFDNVVVPLSGTTRRVENIDALMSQALWMELDKISPWRLK